MVTNRSPQSSRTRSSQPSDDETVVPTLQRAACTVEDRPRPAHDHEQHPPQGRLYDDEGNLWGYYAHGSPVLLTENLASQRGLVNGTMGLMHSLNFGHAEPSAEYLHAERAGKYDLITLEEPPTAVIVRVGDGAGQNFR